MLAYLMRFQIWKRGACVDVVATVTNQSGQALEQLYLQLRADKVPTGVSISAPRVSLDTLADGATAEERLTFSVRPDAQSGPARFELRAATADGRVFAVLPVETTIR